MMEYYRGALGALLVYDITRRVTFENTKKWLLEVRQFGSPEMVVVLVGNKSDLGSDAPSSSREVQAEEAQIFAQSEGLSFLETSAMGNVNVEEAFLEMITKIHDVNKRPKSFDANNMVIHDPLTLQMGKEVIHIAATKHAPNCCAY
ncbi:unnamed protein product [Cuscuta epithymum]|uniref:Uncharacterized protein n=1 Tax=Cuscuta epithymum TaxID=186058 RepID=A0AAV0G9A4_9ASTE|nr:unnamed protein product [Cuscuta epithymum]